MLMLLSSEIHRLRTSISNLEMKAEIISSQPIGWHIQHSLKVINKICIQLISSNPIEYKWKFNPLLNIHLKHGSIPRGKYPLKNRDILSAKYSVTSLIEDLESAIEKLNKIYSLQPSHFCKHPYYGILNLKQTIQFLKLHTQHHLKIIDEIEYHCIYGKTLADVNN